MCNEEECARLRAELAECRRLGDALVVRNATLHAELAEMKDQFAAECRHSEGLSAELAECKAALSRVSQRAFRERFLAIKQRNESDGQRAELQARNVQLLEDLAECRAKLADVINDNRRLADLAMHLPEGT